RAVVEDPGDRAVGADRDVDVLLDVVHDDRVHGDVEHALARRADEAAVTARVRTVPRERAGARVAGALVRLDDEEAVALDREVGHAAGRLARALREYAVGRRNLRAEADLHRVDAALRRGGCGRAALHL